MASAETSAPAVFQIPRGFRTFVVCYFRPRKGLSGMKNEETIDIYGAREHNLKNIDLSIPRDRLVVFTGLSGSG